MLLNESKGRNTHLERFFRNLLLGETNELRNRYMVVNAPEELRAEQVQRIDRTTCRTSNRTSSRFVGGFVKRPVIVKSIDGESRSETSSDIFGELYKSCYRDKYCQGVVSRQA